MWTFEQRKRLELEHAILQSEGLTQFSVYLDRSADTYTASGRTFSNSGRQYQLWISIPSGYPISRPPMYLINPLPVLMADGTRLSSLGLSHNMHTLAPLNNGMIQICHWREDRWHADILLYRVFIKGLIWIEAYEQHLLTGRPIAEFVHTMPER